MEQAAQPSSAFRRAGLSLIAYGTIAVIATIVDAVLYDSLFINGMDFLFIALGRYVRCGSIRATRWSIGFMLLYLLGVALMIPFAAFWPDQLEWNRRSIELGQYWRAAATIALASLWVVVTLYWLLEAMQVTARRWLSLALLLPAAFPIVLLSQVELRAIETNAEIDRVLKKSVDIIAVDAATDERLRPAVTTESSSRRGPRKKSCSSISGGDRSFRIEWSGLGEIHIGVSSPGYVPQQITLDQDSGSQITVKLEQQKPAEFPAPTTTQR